MCGDNHATLIAFEIISICCGIGLPFVYLRIVFMQQAVIKLKVK